MAITRLNNNSITSVTALPSGIDTGKVLQVVTANYTGQTSITGNSLQDVGLSASITPSATSSKVLVFANLNSGAQSGQRHGFNLVRGSSTVLLQNTGTIGSRNANTTASNSNSDADIRSVVFTFLDSPSTTSTTTYKVQGQVEGSSIVYINRTSNNGDQNSYYLGTSQITLMEIEA
jgi:hypothetical protein